MTKRKTKRPHVYFTSKINSERERFEILESSINFDQKEFVGDCLEQMKEFNVEIPELARFTYIPITRMYQIFRLTGQKITDEEIAIIKKRLYLS